MLDQHIYERPRFFVAKPIGDFEGQIGFAAAPVVQWELAVEQTASLEVKAIGQSGLRKRAYDDLVGSLAWVRELVSMIHLAKFSGAPAARAEELVAQIAAAVEDLSELTWQEGLKT